MPFNLNDLMDIDMCNLLINPDKYKEDLYNKYYNTLSSNIYCKNK